VIYYGDEIGMGDNIRLGDRDGVRTPMQWSPDRNGGFSRADWNALRLELHPATRFSWLTAPAMSIWLAHRAETLGTLDFEWKAEGVLLTRPRLQVQPARLDKAGHRLLFGIRLGESVGAAAIATAGLYLETDIGSLFASLVNAGAFAATSHRS